jgi:hypothetical protein
LNVSYVRDGSVHVSQPPGGANVLGRLHFNFPNRFLVYQHNTNERFMFTHEVRAYSRGCMRVQDPAKYAEVSSTSHVPARSLLDPAAAEPRHHAPSRSFHPFSSPADRCDHLATLITVEAGGEVAAFAIQHRSAPCVAACLHPFDGAADA